MAVERAHVTVENLIADHVAVSFNQKNQVSKPETTAAQIRNRITDRFQHVKPGAEQDNAPPAILALRKRLIKAFSPAQIPLVSEDRAEQLVLLRNVLKELRSHQTSAPGQSRTEPVHMDLLLERQQLALKNEITEGFGRVEIWIVSIAVLVLVLLKAIDFLWALSILSLGIGRSWYLDQQCKKRLARIAAIDTLIEKPHA